MKLSLPLRACNLTLNLNKYRNAHYHEINKAKKAFNAEMMYLIPREWKGSCKGAQVELEYTLWQPTARSCDVANICSVVDKFFCDAMTLAEVWDDDDFHTVVSVKYIWGGVDKKTPRCDVEVKKYK